MEKLSLNDIPELYGLSQGAGWEHSIEDWKTILNVGMIYGLRSANNDLMACAGIFEFGKELASIGMVLVCPKEQGKGLGKKLINYILYERNNFSSRIILVAGVKAKSYYEKFGFQQIESISKLVGEKLSWKINIPKDSQMIVTSISMDDLRVLNQIDCQITGGNRERMIRARIEQSQRGVLIKNLKGVVLGFGMGSINEKHLLLGPIEAFNRYVVLKVIQALTKNHKGGIRLDILDQHNELINELISVGFKREAQQPIMSLNGESLPGKRDHLFAITSQAFG